MPVHVAFFVLLCAAAVACGENYCQSGPKYGTQCYTINEVEYQETQVRGETETRPPVLSPSPGCALAGSDGTLVQQPPPGAVPSASPMRPNTIYVMSGACVSRRVAAHAAVR